MKTSSCVEQGCCVHIAANATAATTKAKGIKVKLPSNIEANVELNQNELRSCRLSKW